ncbi:MAG: CDP-alcohol phosphatidyltransferase family protein [Pseudomonadota bacterium]
MSVYDLKPAFQHLLRPLVGTVAKAGITANQVTILTAIASVGYGAALWWTDGDPILFAALPLVLLVRMAFNAIDGMLAREHGQASALGAILNELGDLIADAALILPFMLVAPFSAPWIVAIVALAWLTECAGIAGALSGSGRRYEGPMGKSDRAVLFGVLGLVIWASAPLSPVFAWAQPVICVSLAVTLINRMRAVGALQNG